MEVRSQIFGEKDQVGAAGEGVFLRQVEEFLEEAY
jgi:hypothetical protein